MKRCDESRMTFAAAIALMLLSSAASGSAATASSGATASNPVTPTYATDIAPIVAAHCAPCHRERGSAPFPLETFAQVRGRARQIAAAVSRREMPPWKPEPGFGTFAGERRLSDAQMALFQRWFAGGAAAGPIGAEKAVAAPDDEGWMLGPPDLIVTLSRPYRLEASGRDRMRLFALPVPLDRTRFVKAWQFRTSSPQVVHHATMVLDPTPASRRLDQADPQPGYQGLVPLSAVNPDGYFLGWTPGQMPSLAPDRMAWRLDAGSDLLVMLHLWPNGAAHDVEISLGLYFAETAPSVQPAMIRLNRQDIDIPPGDADYAVVDTYQLPVAVDVYAVQPHAHNLAREIKAFATLPDGSRRWLIVIKHWDFHWQDAYRLASPLALPAGTTLRMEFRYDNSAANPRNPNHPPARVTFGQRTADEMGDLWIQVVPKRPEDLALLTRSLRARLVPQTIAGYQTLLKTDPDNVALHDDLALLYVEAGDLANAAAQFSESLRLNPAAASAHYNLGNALFGLRRFDEAERRFREAIELQPDYGLAHQGLALVLGATNRDEEAARHFDEAVRLTPSAETHFLFGVLRQRQRRYDDALTHYGDALRLKSGYAEAQLGIGLVEIARGRSAAAVTALRQALRLRDHWPDAELALAWVLSTASDDAVRRPDEAVTLAEDAAGPADRQNSRALDVLAAALASAGQFERAEAIARRAMDEADSEGDSDTARVLRARIGLYAQHQSYVDPASAVIVH
jgi:tetratricopeptide (TPR) repeat protein